MPNTLRLVGARGTNKVMAGELSRLCKRGLDRFRLATPKKAGPGALIYPFDRDVARIAAMYHRTASRVLWDLVESSASRLEPLYDDLVAALSTDDRQVFWDGATLSVRARSVSRFAAGERQIVGTVKNALCDAALARGMSLSVDPDSPDLHIAVRQHDDVVTVSVDLVGRAMHLRGYRTQAGLAPLRETLAAALLMLARWDARTEIMLDPMAGSGTIAIEAALMGPGRPLWPAADVALFRVPALADLPRSAPPLFGDTVPRVVANDIDRRICNVASDNARRAGVRIAVDSGDFRRLTKARVAELAGGDAERGVIVCNPPYGERMDADLERLYRDLGAWCAQFSGWRAGFIVAGEQFEELFGAKARVRKPLRNGAIPAMFYLFDL